MSRSFIKGHSIHVGIRWDTQVRCANPQHHARTMHQSYLVLMLRQSCSLLNFIPRVVHSITLAIHPGPLGDIIGDIHDAVVVEDMAPVHMVNQNPTLDNAVNTYLGLNCSICFRCSSGEPWNSINWGNSRQTLRPSSMMGVRQNAQLTLVGVLYSRDL